MTVMSPLTAGATFLYLQLGNLSTAFASRERNVCFVAAGGSMSGALCSASSTAFVQGVTILQISHGSKLPALQVSRQQTSCLAGLRYS